MPIGSTLRDGLRHEGAQHLSLAFKPFKLCACKPPNTWHPSSGEQSYSLYAVGTSRVAAEEDHRWRTKGRTLEIKNDTVRPGRVCAFLLCHESREDDVICRGDLNLLAVYVPRNGHVAAQLLGARAGRCIP